MTKLWILLAVSLMLATIIDQRNLTLRHYGSELKDHFFTLVLILVLGFFCGLRTSGNDTSTYLHMYDQIPTWHDYRSYGKEAYDFSKGIGFGAVSSILKTLGFTAQDYLMFFAVATVIP